MADEKPSTGFNAKEAAGLFIRGMAMGAADVVPGVSGGTIAFITGIYARFVGALTSLSPECVLLVLKGQLRPALRAFLRIHWHVLIPVGLGVGLAVVLFGKQIVNFIDDQPGPAYALFFGLILASAWAPFARMTSYSPKIVVAGLVAAVGAWGVVGLQPDGVQVDIVRKDEGATHLIYAGKLRNASDLDKIRALRDVHAPGLPIVIFDDAKKKILKKANKSINDDEQLFDQKDAIVTWLETPRKLVVVGEKTVSLAWIFVCGIIGISAMVLPGLSGSFLLLFLGVYHAVFSTLYRCVGHLKTVLGKSPDAFTGLVSGDPGADVLFVGTFGVGVLIGLVTFSRVVAALFERARDVTMIALTGLMIGALRLPGQHVLSEAEKGSASWGTMCTVAILGACLVLGLHYVDRRRAQST